MKVVNVLTKNLSGTEMDYAVTKMSTLTFFLSVLKWKEYGFTTKIYVDEFYKRYLSDLGVLDLYDEVDDTYLVDNDLYAEYEVNPLYYWSFSKLFVMQNEDEPIIMADMDFIPLKDFNDIIVNKNELYVYYHERLRNNEINYPTKSELSIADGYEFPEWMTWKENPINACIMYIPNNQEFRDLYISEAIRYAKGNYGDLEEYDNKALTPRTLFAEQRLFSEVAKHLNIKVNDIKTMYELIFNEKAIHLMQYKKAKEMFWTVPFLQKIREFDEKLFVNLINSEQFEEEKKYIEDNGFTYKLPSMLERTKWF